MPYKDDEERKQYLKNWHKKNPGKIKEYRHEAATN